MEWRKLVRELELSKKERIGFLALAFVVTLSLFVPPLLENYFSPGPEIRVDSILVAQLLPEKPSQRQYPKSPRPSGNWNTRDEAPLTPFPFDPNALDEAGWLALGLPEKTVRTILNYRNKGGVFRKKEDLARIYGLKPGQFAALAPFILLPAPEKTVSFERPGRKDWKSLPVDINRADTSAFIALPGIGSRLAGRIISFREKLGGFHSISQVGEVYGLADSVFVKIRDLLVMEPYPLRKINLNTATEEELRAHPYIRQALARPIIAYREAHGKFSVLDDLKKVMAVTNEAFEKMKAYLTTE